MMLDQSINSKTVKEETQLPLEQETPKKVIPPNFKQIGTNFYYVEKSQTVNWYAAQNTCLQMGGHLASINTKEELNALADNIRGYWVDINSLAKEKEYISSTTGARSAFLEWQSGYPQYETDYRCIFISANKIRNDLSS
ncbi:C-type lectin 37Db-like [Drosophila rhopaloa]|uniref:C-type lectin domain-containing protein n=1 Tax=Drosophila rhopaloa TaxID=1041015 RepID=A0ABM5JC02_DRORH|nr:C-type lectin 37Db-like [Drosophila rhopaloa]